MLSSGPASVYSETSNRIVRLLRPASVDCLSKLGLYEAGLIEAESAVVNVAKRICFGNRDVSVFFLRQVSNIILIFINILEYYYIFVFDSVWIV